MADDDEVGDLGAEDFVAKSLPAADVGDRGASAAAMCDLGVPEVEILAGGGGLEINEMGGEEDEGTDCDENDLLNDIVDQSLLAEVKEEEEEERFLS